MIYDTQTLMMMHKGIVFACNDSTKNSLADASTSQPRGGSLKCSTNFVSIGTEGSVRI